MSGISLCIDAMDLHSQRPADMTSRRRMRSLAAVAHPQRSRRDPKTNGPSRARCGSQTAKGDEGCPLKS
jgi:hypothetical protein